MHRWDQEYIHYRNQSKVLGQKFFLKEEIKTLFRKDALNCSEVTVKTFIWLEILQKFFLNLLFIKEFWKKKQFSQKY